MEPEPNAEILSGMPPDRVVEFYHSRKLEALSETELFRAAAHIVSQPKLEPSSFLLHAPLEIMARCNLLPLVSTADRDLARILLVATASHYQAAGVGVSPPERIRMARSSDAAAHLRRAVQQGDVERADALCLSLAGAAHTHIGLSRCPIAGAGARTQSQARHCSSHPPGDALLSNADEVQCESALRTACRIAALSMLEDTPQPAKYYWTHCLTLPHAAWALTRFLPGRSFAAEAAHTAAAWVMAIRRDGPDGSPRSLPARGGRPSPQKQPFGTMPTW